MDASMDGGLRLPSRSLEEPPAAEVAIDSGAATDPASESAPVALDLPNTPVAGGGVDVPAADATAAAAAPSAVAAATQTPVATAEGAPVVDATRQIVLSFSGNSWVDVRDSERKFKLFGEIPKGSRKVLGGQPPYKLVIGNAEAVSITVNGRPFDLAPYAKGNVARFTLDP
jgi:cytoskeleton protein RodZ